MPYLSEKVVTFSICSTLLLAFHQIYGCEATRCGANFENSKCPENLCCSTAGYCGETLDHCLRLCDSKYGRCNPFKVNASIGLPIVGNQCGAKNDFRYCSGGMCCSEYGYCDVTDLHCADGCQPYYGHCYAIANCTLPWHNGNIFPDIPNQQRLVKSAKKNYWYFLCESQHIVKNVTLPLQPVTCNEIDGSWPANYHQECVENVASKAFEHNEIVDVAFDGNLITCDQEPRTNLMKVRIDNAHSLIRDIRITVRKTGRYNFSLSIVDIIRQINVTAHYTKLFNGIINYGQTVVFFVNLKTPLMDKARRFVHFTPHVEMRICEIEVSSYSSGKSNEITLIAVGMSSVIFFLLAALIITVFCLRNQSQRSITIDTTKQNKRKLGNEYSLSIRQRPPLPPSSDIDFQASNSLIYDENHYEYAEIPTYTNILNLQTNLAEPLHPESGYDEAISLRTQLNKPHFPPPPVPRFTTK